MHFFVRWSEHVDDDDDGDLFVLLTEPLKQLIILLDTKP